MTDRQQAAGGFTLVEVLVAITIFAVMAALAYASLDRLARHDERLRASADDLAQLERTISSMENDLRQTVNRSIRSPDGQLAALRGLPGYIELTRTGASSPLSPDRSNLRRIAWQSEDENLIRLAWPILDQAGFVVPERRPMLDGVQQFQLRYLASGRESGGKALPWRNQWLEPELPAAVEFNLELQGIGAIRRVVQFADNANSPGLNNPDQRPPAQAGRP